MDFSFTKDIKWSDINPLNHAIRNEFTGNLLNLIFAVIDQCKQKKGLMITNGFICGKLVDGVLKDSELREYAKVGKCLGFTYDGYTVDSFVKTAKILKELGIGSYLTLSGFYAILDGNCVKVQHGDGWIVSDR